MVKVVVIVAGLNLFVPVGYDTGDKSILELRVLVPQNAPSSQDGSAPGRIAHALKSRKSKWLNSSELKDWEKTGATADEPALIELTATGKFPYPEEALGLVGDLQELSRFSGGANSSAVRPDCVLWDLKHGLDKCTNQKGDPALQAMLVFEGNWEAHAISYRMKGKALEPYAGPVEEHCWRFEATSGWTPADGTYPATPRPLAEGLAFVSEVPTEDAVVKINGSPVSMRKGNPAVCRAAGIGAGEACYAVELLNFPETHVHPGEYFHFLALDELLTRPQAERRWSPTQACCTGQPIDVCMKAVATQCFGGGHPWP